MGFAMAGAVVAGSLIAANASSSAASAQENAANSANDTQKEIYDQNRADAMPWHDAGVGALNTLQTQQADLNRSFTTEDLQADPGYAFRMSEGQKAIERSAAARGGLDSGATMKALNNYAQNSASGEFQNAYNRFTNDQTNRFNKLATIAGVGQTANGQMSQSGQNYADQSSANTLAAGNAQAAGTIGQANAINNGIGTGMNSWMNYQMMNRYAPQTTTTGTTGNSVYNPDSNSFSMGGE